MKHISKIMIIISLVIMSIFISACSKFDAKTIAKNNALADCLTDKGVIMYGTEWCQHCKAQKALFGDSFQRINYVDCDLNPNACSQAGITGYPTWKIDGELYTGEQPLNRLALFTDCEYN